jgi:hypothetical protein
MSGDATRWAGEMQTRVITVKHKRGIWSMEEGYSSWRILTVVVSFQDEVHPCFGASCVHNLGLCGTT